MSIKIKNKKIWTYLVGAILVLTIISGSLFLINRNNQEKTKQGLAAARLPDIVTNYPTPIPLNQTAPITIYFSYGDPNADTDIINPISVLSIDNSSLQFVTNGFKDLYYGDPNRTDATNPPQQAVCNSTYNGPSYDISSSLANPFSITYGLQSARNASAPSGSNTVNLLREKSTGCIQLSVVLSNVAVPGSTVQVIFDEDSQDSVSYGINQRPGRQIVVFTIASQSSSSSSSSISSSSSSSNVSSSSSSLTSSSSSIASSSSISSSSSSISSLSSSSSSSLNSSINSSSSSISSSSSLSSSISSLASSSLSSSSSSQISSSISSTSSSSPASSSSSLSSLSSSSSSSTNGTLGDPNGGGLTGTTGGQAGGSIPLINNTYTGPATYTNGSNCTILGTITNSVFTPNSGEIVDNGCPTGISGTGQITAGGITRPNALSNFTPRASSSSAPNINNIVTNLPRTGGLALVTIVAIIVAGIFGFISFKVYKKRLHKVDLTNDKPDKK